MWKIKRSSSKRKKANHTEEYALQFVDKPMWLERVYEDGFGDLEQQPVPQNQDIQNQSLPLEASL